MNLTEFWPNEEKELLAILLPLLEEATRAGIAGVPLQFNRNLANQQAGSWARQYTDELLRILGTSQRRVVGQALQRWTQQPGASMGSLVDELKSNFDAQRADLIAVTEVTRAYAHGNKIAYQQSGVNHWRWRTNRDALTCKVCGPLNNQVFAIGEVIGNFRGTSFTEPPAHPGCRCWMTPVVNDTHPLGPRRDAQDVIPIGAETRPSTLIEQGNFRVSVPTDLDPARQQLNAQIAAQIVGNALEALPPHLRDVVSEIRLSDTHNEPLEESYRQKYRVKDGSISAATNRHNSAVTVYQNDHLTASQAEDDVREEVSHTVAIRMFGPKAEPTDSEAWLQAMRSDGQFPSRHAMDGQDEDFAATLADYMKDPQAARATYPNRVRLMEQWMEAYGRQRGSQ